MVSSTEVNESHSKHENGNNDSTPSIELSIRTTDYESYAESSSEKLSWRQRHPRILGISKAIFYNTLAVGFLAWATIHHIESSNRYDRIDWPPEENPNSVNKDIAVSSIKSSPASYCPSYCGIQWCDGFGMLIILYAFTYIGLIYYKIVKPLWGNRINKLALQPIKRLTVKAFNGRIRKRIAVGITLIAILAYIVIDALDSPERLQSLSGIIVLIAFAYAFSAHRLRIDYQPVFCGFVLQFLFGVLCIRWDVGRSVFECIGDKVSSFLRYTDFGTIFIYGNELVEKSIVCFAVLPIVFYFSFFISIMFYLGAAQWLIMILGWMLTSIMGTTVCESVTCAANIFIGMGESPLLIAPYIKLLTHSEMHTIMASSFATVSGSSLAAYIAFGADPAHLVTSSVMAAPAAIGFCKLFHPETEESKTKSSNIVLEKSTDSSILDAAANGALVAIPIVLGIAANLIAFVAFVAFLNGIVSYLGFLVGFENVTFELIFSKLFIPLAWLMGIPWEDCEEVAYIVASKTIINEYVAYERLGVLKRDGLISLRSAAIATYAICGYANPCSIGIMIATLSSIAPEKRHMITELAFRAFVSGSMICFLTASIAGVLMTNDMFENY